MEYRSLGFAIGGQWNNQEKDPDQQINSVVSINLALIYYRYFSCSGMSKELEDLASGGSATLNQNKCNSSRFKITSPLTRLLNYYHEAT